MVRKAPTSDLKIRHFTSLADHDASVAKEGQVTFLNFDTYTVRRIIHDGEPFYSVVDAVGALTESNDPGGYWRNTKKRLLEVEGAYEAVTNCYGLKLPAADGKASESGLRACSRDRGAVAHGQAHGAGLSRPRLLG
jgi:hypothetical protein